MRQHPRAQQTVRLLNPKSNNDSFCLLIDLNYHSNLLFALCAIPCVDIDSIHPEPTGLINVTEVKQRCEQIVTDEDTSSTIISFYLNASIRIFRASGSASYGISEVTGISIKRHLKPSLGLPGRSSIVLVVCL